MLVTCSKCKQAIDSALFGQNNKKKNGLDSTCNLCRNKSNRERYKRDPEKYLKMGRSWRALNPEKMKAAQVAWELANPGKHKEASKRWREENSEHFKEVKKAYNSKPENKQRAYEVALLWKEKNRDTIRQKERERRANDPQFRLRRNIRRRIKKVLDTQAKYRYSGACVVGSGWRDKGCTDLELVLHVESLWEPWMTWNNYGNGQDQWNIDHIKPLKSFDLTKREDYLEAVNYTNLRPLHSRQNFSKGCKEV